MKTKNKTAISTLIAVTVAFFILVAFSATASADDPPCSCGDICANEAGWWRAGGDFNASNTPIQHAIDNASAGDTICVKDGTYNENVDVKGDNLTIRSENGSASTIVTASNPNDHVFKVTKDYVNISGFMVQNDATGGMAGIYLYNNVEHCNISNNNVSNNYYGIYLYDHSSNNTLTNNTANSNYYGIYLQWYSSDNTLSNNTANSNHCGIFLYSYSSDNTLTNNTANSNTKRGIYLYDHSSNNTLSNNTANSNSWSGIYLCYSCNYNTLTGNNASSNDIGIYLTVSSNYNTLTGNNANSNGWGSIYLYSSNNNTLTGNNANSNNIGIQLYSSNNNTLTSNNASSNDIGICLESSSNNTLTGNNANSNNGGIYLDHSSDNTLTDNNANSNYYYGIYLEGSSNNTLTDNTANSNYYYGGILLYGSSDNLIYNNYFNNTNNAYDDGTNIWNITKTAGTNIIGGSWLGGNYWSDYSGEDTNEDGIGETLLPYNSSGNITTGGDWLPLVPVGVAPPNITSFAPPSPVNDTVCTWRNFNVTVNQTVNVSWYLNKSFLFKNESVKEANYTLHAEIVGEHNVFAVAENANGTDMQTWVWNVKSAPDTTPATIDFDPDTLNKKSKGKWVTVYTELPAGYDVTDINVSTMMLNETVPAELHPTEIGDYDSDGIPDLMVKFDRQAVIDMLPIGDAVNVTVTGKLYDGTPFEGNDVIRVIDKGKGK